MTRPVLSEKVTIEGVALQCTHCRNDLFVVQRANVWLGWLPWGGVRRRQAKGYQCLRCGHLMLFR